MKGRVRAPRVEKYVNEKGFKVLEALDAVAVKHKAKPGQIALAWLIARPSVTSPIASATNMDQFKELVGAATVTLDKADIDQIDAASKP